MKINQQTSNWTAWYNVQPPGPHTLHVKGQIDVGNASDSAELVFEGIEKSLPPNLILRIKDRTIFIPRDPEDHIVHLHYSAQASLGSYGIIKIVLEKEIVHEIPGSEIGIAH
jgi:hypothetical protein